MRLGRAPSLLIVCPLLLSSAGCSESDSAVPGCAGGASSGCTGGSSGSGGSADTEGPGGGSGGSSPPTSGCTFEITSSLSEAIQAVGIVTFTTSLASLESARVEFGLDTDYGSTAPVDLQEADYRTLLLGMKADRTYHFRVVVSDGTTECASDDQTITTGDLPTNLPNVTITTHDPAAVAGGFLVTGTYQTGPVYVMDADGDFVWWYSIEEGTRARMSWDGKYMWIARGNVPETMPHVVRVSMDGLDVQDFSDEFPRQNHDFAVLPDETIVYIAYSDNGCDDVIERSPNGTSRLIINSGVAQGVNLPGMCRLNAVEHSDKDDTIIFSDFDNSNLVKVTRQGEVVWVLGSTNPTLDSITWQTQHGIQALEANRILFFDNGGPSQGSRALEMQLDGIGGTAEVIWHYLASPAISNVILGDVQRLENGNTLVTYSTQGVVHEVNADREVVQSIVWPLGGALGYATKRASLYGPPPR